VRKGCKNEKERINIYVLYIITPHTDTQLIIRTNYGQNTHEDLDDYGIMMIMMRYNYAWFLMDSWSKNANIETK